VEYPDLLPRLALEGALLSAAKVGILTGSVASSVLGVVVLMVALPKDRPTGNPGSLRH
jgi:Na+/H+ antiporter NhaA